MASDLTGMFNQLNKAITGMPSVQPMVDMMSQGAGNMLAPAFNKGLPEGQQMNSMSFMNEGGVENEGRQALARLDLSTVDGKAEAAKILSQMGKPMEAMTLATQVKEEREKEGKEILLKKQQAGLLDVVSKDGTLTAQDRQYYYDAINAGTIKTREDYLTAKRGASTGDYSILNGGMIEDENGNIYNTTTVTDKLTGVPRTEYAVVGQGPEAPVGEITPISRTTGQNGATTHLQRLNVAKYQSYLRMSEAELDSELKKGNIDYQTAADIRKQQSGMRLDLEQQWQEQRNEIVMNIPEVMQAQQSTQKALDLLDTTSTSGISTSLAKIADMAGIGDTSDYATLNSYMSSYVLENLKKMGANPTEGERAFLIDAAANISRGTEANVALFEKTLKRLNMNAEAAKYLLENPAATRDEYVTKYNTIVEAQNSTRRIKLGDMQ